MVKVFEFAAPESIRLTELSPAEAEKAAAALAEDALDRFSDLTPVGVNVLALSSKAGDVGGWVQWTRACCDKRRRIEEFEEPLLREVDSTGIGLPSRVQEVHFESQLRTVRLQGPDHVAE